MNPSYFDVNRRGTIGFDTLPYSYNNNIITTSNVHHVCIIPTKGPVTWWIFRFGFLKKRDPQNHPTNHGKLYGYELDKQWFLWDVLGVLIWKIIWSYSIGNLGVSENLTRFGASLFSGACPFRVSMHIHSNSQSRPGSSLGKTCNDVSHNVSSPYGTD